MQLPAVPINPWKSTADGYIYRPDGYVGIGTDSPTEKLHVDGFARADDPVLPVHLATKAYVDNQLGIGPVATTEAFTIYVDGTNGSDPTVNVILNTQEESDLYLFKTIPAAIKAIPAHILHPITLSVADGTYAATSNIFGDLSRFTFGWSEPSDLTNGAGQIRIKSTDGLQIVSGTAQMSVASTTNDHDFDVTVDPGLVADTYRGYFIRVVSGTGAGQIKAIYTHSGTNFKVAGRFSPNINATSVVEIVSSEVVINLDALTINRDVWTFNQVHASMLSLDNMPLSLEDIVMERTATNISLFIIGGGVRILNGFRGVRVTMIMENSYLSLDNAVLDGRGVGSSSGIIRIAGGGVRARSSDSSWLVNGGTGAGVRLIASELFGFKSQGFLFKGRIENCVNGIEIENRSYLETSTGLFGGSNSGYGVVVEQTSRYQPDLTDMADVEHLTGSLGAVQIDAAHVVSYSEIDNSPDDIIIGQENSVVKGINGIL